MGNFLSKPQHSNSSSILINRIWHRVCCSLNHYTFLNENLHITYFITNFTIISIDNHKKKIELWQRRRPNIATPNLRSSVS